MQRKSLAALIASASTLSLLPSLADAQTVYSQRTVQQLPATQVAYQQGPGGGGLLEFLFNGGPRPQGYYQQQPYQQQPRAVAPMPLEQKPIASSQPSRPSASSLTASLSGW